jgi:hypothetical protein
VNRGRDDSHCDQGALVRLRGIGDCMAMSRILRNDASNFIELFLLFYQTWTCILSNLTSYFIKFSILFDETRISRLHY